MASVSDLFFLCRLKLFRGVEDAKPYQGARDLESLFQFVMETVAAQAQPQEEEDETVAEAAAQAQPQEEEEEEEEKELSVERDEHGVLHLTDENFSRVINTKEGILFVKFYAPW